jgi:type IV pilus assembly protein PilA
MKKLGKSSKKGFTLVELIVVLVILAVLAAMLVPALIGYIDRARAEKEYQTAATVYGAAQAVITELYAKDEFTTGQTSVATGQKLNSMGEVDAVLALAGVSEDAVKAYEFNFSNNIITDGDVQIGKYVYHLEMDTNGAPVWTAAEGELTTGGGNAEGGNAEEP